jgi:MoxR-like ATPase
MALPAKKTDAGIDGQALLDTVRQRLRLELRGKDEVIELALAALLARGHLLLEGPPGTGKTSLAKAMATAFGGTFRRIQLTSDLLPSDVVGILRLKAGGSDFEFRHGPIFANFLLADELNRTSPKTQSALLEAMAEGTVTVDGVTHALPDPFFVIATQNPLEFHGVYPLAESQLDRFMLQLSVTSPEKRDELEIYQRASRPGNEQPRPVMAPGLTREQADAVFKGAEEAHVEETVLEYATDLVRATRYRSDISFGVSVRGGLQFIAAAKALAYVRGRGFVVPKDVTDLAVPVLAHRLCFANGEPDGLQRVNVIREIVDKVRPPK